MAIMSCFAPHVQRYVEEMLKIGKVGICSGAIKIASPLSGCNSFVKNAKCDRFKLIIPYGGHSITWDVLFHANHPDFAPDFIFCDKTFKVQLEDVESLCSWNPDDPTCLLRVVQELIEEFQKQQVKHLEDYSRLQFEYSSLVQQTGFSDKDVEVFISNKNRSVPVNFLIRLPIDFSKIPPMLSVSDNPGEDTALLLVTFQTPDGNRIIPQLFLSPRVERALGGSQVLRIPSFPSEGCLMDYVPTVTQLLANKVEQVVLGYEKRKEFVASFLSYFGRSIIEYDSEAFTDMNFLFELNDFYFLVIINLPLCFPMEKPMYTIMSVYHTTSGKPYTVFIADYPYSPRWSTNEMAERARSFFMEYIPIFQRNSVKTKN